MKIQDFPELVEVYNKSLFFSDLTLIEAKEIYTYDDNEYDNLVHILGEREAYLQKNKIEDICKYSEWLDTKDTGTFHMSFHVSYQDKDTELLAKSSAGINIVNNSENVISQ